jgi:hypothetical protein
MFISFDEKKRIKDNISELFAENVRLERRIAKMESDAEKHGYRKTDGRPKRKTGRPRKQEVTK